jgi:hypothetical protein
VVETGERRRPDLTRNPVQIRAAPAPRVVQPRPQPQQPPRQQATGGAPRERLNLENLRRSLGGGSPQGQPGAPGGSGPARQPSATLSGPERQAISRQIGNLIQPCTRGANPPNAFARSISVVLEVTVTQAGAPTSHRLVSSAGTNDTNDDYVDEVVGTAMRVVRACASRIATLPDEQYAVAGGWRTFRYRFRFP